MFGSPQPTPFDLHWRMFGIDVRVHPFFWIMSAMLGWNWFEAGGNRGLMLLLLWVLCVFVSILLHELGHVVMGRLFGAEGHILLYSFGGLAIGAGNQRQRWQRILVDLAGVAAQFTLYGSLLAFRWLILPSLLPEEPSQAWRYLFVVLIMLLDINLFWPILNLLPIWPLDGGQVSREVFEGWLGQRGVIISLGVSLGVSALLAVELLLRENHHGVIPFLPGFRGLYSAIFFALFAITSFQALQAERSRYRPERSERMPWE